MARGLEKREDPKERDPLMASKIAKFATPEQLRKLLERVRKGDTPRCSSANFWALQTLVPGALQHMSAHGADTRSGYIVTPLHSSEKTNAAIDAYLNQTKLTGRGGPGRGQGRKPGPVDQVLVPVSLRFSQTQREKLEALGGPAWIRAKLDKTKPETAPAAPVEGRRYDAEPGEVLHVMPMRMTAAQRNKLAELGGGAWLRKRVDLARLPK